MYHVAIGSENGSGLSVIRSGDKFTFSVMRDGKRQGFDAPVESVRDLAGSLLEETKDTDDGPD